MSSDAFGPERKQASLLGGALSMYCTCTCITVLLYPRCPVTSKLGCYLNTEHFVFSLPIYYVAMLMVSLTCFSYRLRSIHCVLLPTVCVFVTCRLCGYTLCSHTLPSACSLYFVLVHHCLHAFMITYMYLLPICCVFSRYHCLDMLLPVSGSCMCGALVAICSLFVRLCLDVLIS